jgi:hypothetical protein
MQPQVSHPLENAALSRRTPEAVFAEAGIPVPPNKKIRVVEETHTLGYFILPSPPGGGSLSEAELDAVAGGGGTGIMCAVHPVRQP